MRNHLPAHFSAVLVGACLVGCGDDPIVRLEVRVATTTERIELRANVQERCAGHDCYHGVSGFAIEAETPDGRVVPLYERPHGELSGTYVADTIGIVGAYTFLLDGTAYVLESPARYTAWLTMEPEPRIDWSPPTAEGDSMRVSYTKGGPNGGGGGIIGSYVDHAPLNRLQPGTYRIVIHRERQTPLSEDPSLPPGLVTFDWVFDVAIDGSTE